MLYVAMLNILIFIDDDVSEKRTKVATEGKKKGDKQKDTSKKATLLQAKTDKEV